VNVDLPEKLHTTNWIAFQKKVPLGREIERTLEQSQLTIDGRTRDLRPTTKLVAFDIDRANLSQLSFVAEILFERLQRLFIS
jgi:hypothetical protein